MTASLYPVALHGDTLLDVSVKKTIAQNSVPRSLSESEQKIILADQRNQNSRNKATDPWSSDTLDGRRTVKV
jgi:hypothetical protein